MSAREVRAVLIAVHPTRADAAVMAKELADSLIAENFTLFSNNPFLVPGSEMYSPQTDIEVVVVLGGDGTILRGAELIYGDDAPIIGINMGNVGFLAEVIRPTVATIVAAIRTKQYAIESRLLLSYAVERAGKVIENGWAMNEITLEKSHVQMVELFVQVDGRPLSRWGCDGVIVATPTGSTAYAFSAGGPVLWPQVEALVLLPLAAHALFSRPMVIAPTSSVVVDIESESAELAADSMRRFSLQAGDRISVSRDVVRVRLAHIDGADFTDRLVAKFKLPIEGWRGERN
jgi:NAD+ kinase